MSEALELVNVTKRYGERVALDHVSLRVDRGRPTALLGRNGAGKSTVLKLLLGRLRPDAGRAVVPAGCRVGYLPEERGVYKSATVRRQLTFFAELTRPGRARAAVDEWLERLQLTAVADVPAKALSKGNAQKLQVALALVDDPDVLILDEPFSGLDPMNRQLFADLFAGLAHDRYFLMTSHRLDWAEELCLDAVILDAGRVVAADSITALRTGAGPRRLQVTGDPSGAARWCAEHGWRHRWRDGAVLIDRPAGGRATLDALAAALPLADLTYARPSLEELFTELVTGGHHG